MSQAPSFHFELITPERILLSAELRQLSLPTERGEITILAHHIPLVSLVKAGVLELTKADGVREILSISGGVLELFSDKVVLLADSAEHAAHLDESIIQAARAKAEALRQNDEFDFAVVTALIEKELARDQALKRWKKLKNIETIN